MNDRGLALSSLTGHGPEDWVAMNRHKARVINDYDGVFKKGIEPIQKIAAQIIAMCDDLCSGKSNLASKARQCDVRVNEFDRMLEKFSKRCQAVKPPQLIRRQYEKMGLIIVEYEIFSKNIRFYLKRLNPNSDFLPGDASPGTRNAADAFQAAKISSESAIQIWKPLSSFLAEGGL